MCISSFLSQPLSSKYMISWISKDSALKNQDWILYSISEATEEDSHRTIEEKDDMTKQAQIPPCHWVYKRGQPTDQLDRGVH
jgi:hypothetical protein